MTGTRPEPARALTLVASEVAPVGGMERVAFELARRLLDRGWHLTVIARRCDLPPSPNLRHVRLPSPNRPVSVALLTDAVAGTLAVLRHRNGLVQTNNAIVLNRVDVINVHFSEAAFVATAGESRASRPTPAYRLNSWLAARIHVALERWEYRPRRVRALACVSTGVARETADHYPELGEIVQSIPNGVDLRRFAPDPGARTATRRALGLADDTPVALFMGGDWRRKGLETAIDAVAQAADWRLLVVGGGDERRYIEHARRRGAGARVVFTGRVSDPETYYAAADVLVFPSRYEAFSLVTLEAAAAGLVILANRINGTDELVVDGVNGWFVDAGARAIATRLDQLAADRTTLGEMGRAARATAERYDWDRIVERYEELYAKLGDA